MSSDEESDVEQQTLPKKTVKITPKSPRDNTEEARKKRDETKKQTTKQMLFHALAVLHTRAGVSMYAIKKFLEENYQIDTKKNNNIIKKQMKLALDSGFIIQTKGIGATGSFKIAKDKIKKEKPKSKPETKKEEKNKKSKNPEEKADKAKKIKMSVDGKKKTENKKLKAKEDKTSKPKKPEKIVKISKPLKNKDESTEKLKVKKDKVDTKQSSKAMKSPKKRTIMKRKSIGSIIKAPKMKPKARM